MAIELLRVSRETNQHSTGQGDAWWMLDPLVATGIAGKAIQNPFSEAA
ncbi:hypothetical protein [Bradyrhizobium sp. TM233]